MKKLTISTSTSYDIIIGRNLIELFVSNCKSKLTHKKLVIISDSNVWNLYGERLLSCINNGFIKVINFIITPGEQSKNLSTVTEIYSFLAENNVSKNDMLVSLGGGVVGDITGYVASTYMRGIKLIHIPTTLTSQVDSAIGGKTGVNLPNGKNLVGTFYNPELVLCDVDLLNSLDDNEISNGMAEVIKYYLIKDAGLYDLLKEDNIKPYLEHIVYQCAQIKKQFVETDPFDTNQRKTLNFGHSLGHSIEKIGNYSEISHGEAVGLGMLLITKFAVKNHIADQTVYSQLIDLLNKFDLNTSTNIPMAKIVQNIFLDKKVKGDIVDLIIVPEIGTSIIYPMKLSNIHEFFH